MCHLAAGSLSGPFLHTSSYWQFLSRAWQGIYASTIQPALVLMALHRALMKLFLFYFERTYRFFIVRVIDGSKQVTIIGQIWGLEPVFSFVRPRRRTGIRTTAMAHLCTIYNFAQEIFKMVCQILAFSRNDLRGTAIPASIDLGVTGQSWKATSGRWRTHFMLAQTRSPKMYRIIHILGSRGIGGAGLMRGTTISLSRIQRSLTATPGSRLREVGLACTRREAGIPEALIFSMQTVLAD